MHIGINILRFKKIGFICALALFFMQLRAQVISSHDGFYNADSVFYQLSGSGSFKYCVNCYSADSLKNYAGGIWLHSREHTINTWENSPFSKPSHMFDDSGHIRADVVKANTIWVRVYNDSGAYTDQHHFVFLGTWRPKTAAVISILIDSSDFMGQNGIYGPGKGMQTPLGYRWNYMLKLEKKCSYQVFAGKDFHLEASQTAGVEISATESASYLNKAIELNANKTQNKGGTLLLGKSLTDSLGSDIKILRVRVGGPTHRSNILSDEIALDILGPAIGGEPSTPVCLFINGSFWTYGFAEEGLDRNHISKIMKTPTKQLTSATSLPAYAMSDISKAGLGVVPVNISLYSICGFFSSCWLVYTNHDTIQFRIDTLGASYDPKPFDTLYNVIKSGSDLQLATTINKEEFYKYALSIWYFQNQENWGSHLMVAKSGGLPWTLFADHYDFTMPDPPMANDWDKYFTNCDLQSTDGGSRKTLPWQATKRTMDYDRDYFCLIIEDELNTTYKPERVVSLAQKKIASLRPCISECSKAWYPYGWQDSLNWEATVSGIIPFLNQRAEGIAAALPENFMAGADTLYELKDRNTVTVSFDSLRGTDVAVKLNSLEIRSEFSGLYYPKPQLRISLEYDTGKYVFVKWVEYPDEPAAFRLSAKKPITLTPVLRPKQ